ncbi:hypothetical protein F4678DRAFT_456215 [Xylaria arbuscula]|nr:hypothetical protein F4678DRAFT_456215 [Xylaria arbuscula]
MVADSPRLSSRVCVVGGGLVGLAGSILLRHQGFEVTVLERNTTLETAGYGIQLHPNGVRVLQDMGIYERLMTKSSKGRTIVLRAYDTGRVMHEQDLSELESKYGTPVLTLHRAHLLECLYETAVKEGVQIHMGTSVEASSIDVASAQVISRSHADGGSHSWAIEADGIGSAVRTAMDGLETDIKPHGHVVNRVAVDKSAVRAIPSLRHFVDESSICLWMGPGGM